MEKITSKSNDKVKFLKSLNEKKFRQKYDSFYVEGIKVVKEAINQAVNIMFIAYSDDILKSINGGTDILNFLKKLDIEKVCLDKKTFEYITDTVTTQGILAVIQIPKYDVHDILKNEEGKENNNILILDRVQDAGNIGTIIRTADAFNVNRVLCINGTTDIYSPKVIRSTMGSIFRVKTVYIDVSDMDILKKYGYNIIGTDIHAKKTLKDIDYYKKIAFVMGNEANGVSDKVKCMCDDSVLIKMENTAESLNVAVATAIILYEQYGKN